MSTDVEKSAESSNVHLSEPFMVEPHIAEHEKTEPQISLQGEVVSPYSGIQWFLVCAALYCSCFLYGLDNTIVADVQAAIVEDLNNVQQLAWLGVGFPLGSIATILSVGKAYGIFDMKWVFIISQVLFEVGSAICGAAPNMRALIVGRVIAGAGGSGMYLGILNIISHNTSPVKRAFYIGLTAPTWGLGAILGPVIGGALADSSASWRWAFYINLLIFAISAPIYVFCLKSQDLRRDLKFSDKLKKVDWLGSMLNAGTYTAFVLAFTLGGVQWAWNDGRTIALIVVFGVALILFAIQQTFSIFTSPTDRIFPIDFLRSRDLVALYVAMSAASTALLVGIYYIPIYFSFAKGVSNIEAAVRMLPYVAIVIFSILFNGATMPVFKYYAPWYLVNGIFLIIGASLMYKLVNVETSPAHIYGYSVLLAFGAGLSFQAGYSVVQAKVPPHRVPDAVNYMNTAQIGAITIALTVSGALFQNLGFLKVSKVLVGQGFSTDEVHSALSGVQSSLFTRVTPETRDLVIEAIVSAIGSVYIFVFVAGAISIIASLCMKWEKIFV